MGSVQIHDIETITKVERFTYLKSFLADSALATISRINLNTENSKEAIDIIENDTLMSKCFYDKICSVAQNSR